jgi:hypothetical protein
MIDDVGPLGRPSFSHQGPTSGIFDAEQCGTAKTLLSVECAAAIGRYEQRA